MTNRISVESGGRTAVLTPTLSGVGGHEEQRVRGGVIGGVVAGEVGGYQMARGIVESKCGVVRRQAEAVLAELIRERAEAEDRQNATKRTDPYKLVSGVSSLDRAIDETRVLLRRLDEAEAAGDR